MAAEQTPLPEGTDHIINGAAETGDGESDTRFGGTSGATAGDSTASQGGGSTGSGPAGGTSSGDTRGAFFEKFEEVRAQSYDRAREYALVGKDRATGALDDFIRMVNDAAAQVDDKVGSQYGDYARRAVDGLGSFNEALKGKDVDQLFTEARDLVARAPAVAVGTAAALGFIIARLAKAGLDNDAKPATNDAPTG